MIECKLTNCRANTTSRMTTITRPSGRRGRPSQSPSPGSEDTQNEGEFENICLCYYHLPRIQEEGQWKTIPFAF